MEPPQLLTPLGRRAQGLARWMWTPKCVLDLPPQPPFIMGTPLPNLWEAGKCLRSWEAPWSYGIIFEVSSGVISLVLGRSQLEHWAPLQASRERGVRLGTAQKNAKRMTKGAGKSD